MSATVSAHATEARTSELFTPELRGLTIGLVSTITLVALESLAIGTVMPIVAKELGQLELYGWVFSAFFLGNLVGTVVAGGALDRMPLRRPFAVGLGLFATGLLVGGLAPSMPVLVAARFVQGLGGGTVGPTAYVAIGRCLPQRLQPRMFAILSTAWVVPGIIGPSLAALVGTAVGWRWVFLGLLPLLAAAGLLALSALRNVPAATPDPSRPPAARRLPNALLAAAGAGLIVAALTSEAAIPALVGSVIGLVLLVPAFRRLTPPGTLRLLPGVPAAVLMRGVLTFAFFAGDAYIPLLLQTWRGTSAALTGIVFTATTLTWTAGTWLQARRVDRLGPRWFVRLGLGCPVAGAGLTIPVVIPTVPPEVAIVSWSIAGIGMGFAYSSLSLLVLRDSAPAEQGAATSALQLSDILGTALGTGLGGALTAAGERAGGNGLGIALGAVYVLTVVVATLGLAGATRLGGRVGLHSRARSAAPAAVD